MQAVVDTQTADVHSQNRGEVPLPQNKKGSRKELLIRISDDLTARLDAAAEACGRNRNTLIAEAIELCLPLFEEQGSRNQRSISETTAAFEEALRERFKSGGPSD